MSTNTQALTVLLLDGRDEPARAVVMALEAIGAIVLRGGAEHLDSLAFDLVVAHPSTPGWPRVVERVCRDHPERQVIALVDELGEACVAINELAVSGVAMDVAMLTRQLEKLVTSPADLETRVQERTSTLQQIKAQWEQTFDAVRDPLAVLDEQYRVIRANRAYAELLGLPIVEVPGRICYQLRDGTPGAFAELDDISRCRECPVPQVRKNGEAATASMADTLGRRWLVSAFPVKLAGQPTSLVVHYRDVSALHARQDTLVRESKRAAVGDLAGAIAHELNSPMTSIMVFSEALARKTAEGSELNDNALEINEAARRCRRLIQGLLRFARRPRSVEMSGHSLGQIVDEIRPLLEHRLAVAGVTLDYELPPSLPALLVHVSDLEHVFVDLLVNALEACSSGDRIVLRARELANELLEVVVQDNGSGMSEEVRAQAFDPFFTTKSATQGTGLGLTSCEALITQMGGTIELTSTVGEGTCVVLQLPVAR